GPDDDVLDGMGGVNRLLGGRGRDLATMGAFDLVDLGLDQDGLVLRGTAGDDDIRVSRRVDEDGPHAVFQINGQTIDQVYSNGETIFVFAGAGNDVVVLNESAKGWWKAEFHGEEGNDILIGVNPDDDLRGGPGLDSLIGPSGHVQGGPAVRFVHAIYRQL